MIKKMFAGIAISLLFAMFFAANPQSSSAQTQPVATSENGYPLPATPEQPGGAYPGQGAAANNDLETPYIAPTNAASTTIGSGVNDSNQGTSLSSTQTLSSGAIVRNRAILWAGFLITLLIFAMAVYGAMLMYTRRQK